MPSLRVRHDASVKIQRITGDPRNSFIVAMFSWTMDAFDYFIVVFVYDDIAKNFPPQQSRSSRSLPWPP